jgi:hypothetical protein
LQPATAVPEAAVAVAVPVGNPGLICTAVTEDLVEVAAVWVVRHFPGAQVLEVRLVEAVAAFPEMVIKVRGMEALVVAVEGITLVLLDWEELDWLFCIGRRATDAASCLGRGERSS